jgi:hypothetical protein
MGLVVEDQVEPKGFQVQEEQVDQVLEEEANQVDPEPGRQLEDGQVNWDTLEEKKLDFMRNTQMYHIKHTMTGARGKGASGGGGKSF